MCLVRHTPTGGNQAANLLQVAFAPHAGGFGRGFETAQRGFETAQKVVHGGLLSVSPLPCRNRGCHRDAPPALTIALASLPTKNSCPQEFLRSQMILKNQNALRVRRESSDAMRVMGLAFQTAGRRAISRADRKAEREARKQARQLGLQPQVSQSNCQPPRVWDAKQKRCRRDMRRAKLRKPRGCRTEGDMVRKAICRDYARRRKRRIRKFLIRTRRRILRERGQNKPAFKYAGMTAQAAQAVFSIKPHHFPHALPDLGDNYIEGYSEDKPIKRLFADKTVDAAEPHSHPPQLFGGDDQNGAYSQHVRSQRMRNRRRPSRRRHGSAYVRGYINPYARDSLTRPNRSGMGERSGTYNPRKRDSKSYHSRPRSRPLKRLIRNLDRGPFEGRNRDPFWKTWPAGTLRGPYDYGGRTATMGVQRARKGHRTPHTPHYYGRNNGYPRLRALVHPRSRPGLEPRDMGKRELKDLIKALQNEPASSGKKGEVKEAKRELHKRELAELNGGIGCCKQCNMIADLHHSSAMQYDSHLHHSSGTHFLPSLHDTIQSTERCG